MHAILRTLRSYLQNRISVPSIPIVSGMNGCCLEATRLLSVLMQPVNRKQEQEPFALPLPMEPLAHRVHGARAGNSQTCPPGAYTQSILIAFLTLCACVLLLVAAVSGTVCGSPMIALPSMRRARQKPRRSGVGPGWSRLAPMVRVPLTCLNSKPGRADLWLRSELEINAKTIGCQCYCVIPRIGSYDEQVVACNGSVCFRRNRFHERWSRE